MDQQYDEFVPIVHTCSNEERRFDTCNCAKTSRRADENLHPRSGFTGEMIWPVRLEEKAQRREELSRRLSVLTSGQRIRHLRSALGWSQQECATQLGVSRRTLVRFEGGLYGNYWTRPAMLMRLRQLELTHEERLIMFARGGRLATQAG
jgi:DNA-binding XRE family transcriptional regulator